MLRPADGGRTELTVREFGYATAEARDVSRAGLEQCLDTMQAIYRWCLHPGRMAGRGAGYLLAVTVWETILVYVVPTVGLYLLIVLLVVAPRMARKPRYRAGQPWPYEPLWWTANPKGAQLPSTDGLVVTGERGGARGNW